jgi:RsiW-degrading membrane proteinase PrsW (M82 family)
VLLWVLYAFVFYEIREYAGSSEVVIALAISAGLVLLFNTASIIAMIVRLNSHRKEIYGLDLHYLDLKKQKRF